jgi:serine/threonine-protein kinase
MYRQSPVYLVPDGFHALITPGMVTFDDPPAIQSGMINVALDGQGRLSYWQALPEEVEANPPPSPPVDWKPLFEAARLDLSRLQPASPTRVELAAFDERAAWTGTWPGSDFPLRVEAAAWQGKPVYFELLGPWSAPHRSPHMTETRGQRASQILYILIAILLTAGGALLARRNYAQGKADVSGAFRLASAVFVIGMTLWVCLNHFVPTRATFVILVLAVSASLFLAGATWVTYVALEPYVRRRWPHAIISWTRLLAGNLRDPLVGRDLLWGVLLGVLWSLIVGVGFLFLKREGATPQLPNSDLLLGSRQALASWIQNLGLTILSTLQTFFLIFILRVLLRKYWAAMICFVGIAAGMQILQSDHPQIVWPVWLIVYTLAAGAVLRFGLIVLATAIFTANVLLNLPYTVDASLWYAAHTAAMVGGIIALAGWGFYASLGGQKLWKADLFD